ncbi:MAG: tRNA (cytidine(56)-2'-O)-methyltransferase [Methanomassiliicoccales archaeon]|nr:MAG: tRNA (cytidine(56)-2'-O)-methyltransferase [Methanomassiliicoccales archaeon]
MITVLRLGHRKERDKRVTTHVGLVARAFGANQLLISTKDEALERTLNDVTDRFGGEFQVKTGVKWRKILKNWEGMIVHLTMYGEIIDDILPKIPKKENLMIVVGAEKVPGDVYKMAHFNIAVGNQPHSEVAALAVFLDRVLKGKGLQMDFQGKVRIIPSKKGKKVVEIE